jgi:hypothetical protein
MTAEPRRAAPKYELVGAIAGVPGELLAAMWYQGVLLDVTITAHELVKARGHGVELFRDQATGDWQLIAVNHPWVGPPPNSEERTDDRPIEHQL